MTQSGVALWAHVRDRIDDAVANGRTRRAWVGTETDGMVTLAWSRGGTVGVQKYPRLAGPSIPDGAEVQALPLGNDQYLVLGAVQVGGYNGNTSAGFVSDIMSNAENYTGSTLTDHIGEVGATWTAHPSAAGEWSWADGRYYPTTPGIVTASGTPPGADYVVSCRYRYLSNTGAVGIAGRIQSGAATCYYAYHNSGQWVLARLSAGTPTTINTSSVSLTAGSDYLMELSMVGTAISLIVNGVTEISGTDSAITTAGSSGLRSAAAVTATTGKHVSHFQARGA